jgi:hypothetical protein
METHAQSMAEDIDDDLKQSLDDLADQFLRSAHDDGPRKDGSV